MKKVLVCIFPLVLQSLWAQEEIPVTDILLLPPEFYVGDLVEMRVNINFPSPELLTPSSDYPLQDWLDIRKVELVKDDQGSTVVIRFVSYSPGTRAFPPIRLSAGILSKLSISTLSVLNDEQLTLAPYREPLNLPGSETQIAFIVVLLVFVPFLVIFLFNFFLKFIRQAKSQWAFLHPYSVLFNDLKFLRKRCYGMSTAEFYSSLSMSIREWLGKCHKDKTLLSLTADEWSGRLEELQQNEPLVWVDIFQRCERWIYGGGENLEENRIRDLERALETAERDEKERKENARL